MDKGRTSHIDPQFVDTALEAAVRIGMVALLGAWCFSIMRPFVGPVTWGIIIAVAVYPLYQHLVKWLSGRGKLAAALFTLLALALLMAMVADASDATMFIVMGFFLALVLVNIPYAIHSTRRVSVRREHASHVVLPIRER